MKVDTLDDLHWKAYHKIGDISISIIQGKGCHGSRAKNNFEVLVSDSKGDIPLDDDNIGSYYTEKQVVNLINLIDRVNAG